MESTSTATASVAPVRRHVFAHLAPGPYTYRGVTQNRFSPAQGVPSKPGGTCDHCRTGIEWEFHFTGSGGAHFKVGSTCVEKSGDSGMRRVIADDVRKHQANLAKARDERNKIEIAELMADDSVRASLTSQPHPNAYYASQGKTLLDYFDFTLRCSGASGRASTLKALRALKVAA